MVQNQNDFKKGERPSAEPPSERELAKQLEVSRAWLWRARQVYSIPEDEFEAMVESENVPTIERLVQYARSGELTRPKRGRKQCPHCGGEL
jgi:hypothetical protein